MCGAAGLAPERIACPASKVNRRWYTQQTFIRSGSAHRNAPQPTRLARDADGAARQSRRLPVGTGHPTAWRSAAHTHTRLPSVVDNEIGSLHYDNMCAIGSRGATQAGLL